jgi:hypothetical protein
MRTVGMGNGELSPYQKALTRLQADAPPMDPQLAKDVVRADLGRSVEDVFAEFTDEPMAAAFLLGRNGLTPLTFGDGATPPPSADRSMCPWSSTAHEPRQEGGPKLRDIPALSAAVYIGGQMCNSAKYGGT